MINILHTPENFQPAFSDGLFYTISADTTDKYKFRYVYNIYVDDSLIFEGKATPNSYDLGVIDVSRVVNTYTENNPISWWNTTPIYQHQTFPFSRPYQDAVVKYQVYFGYEYSDTALGSVTGFTGVGDGLGAPAVDGGVYKTYYGTYGVNGRATQENFNFSPFVLSGTPTGTYPTTSGLYLTNSPRIRNIQESEYYTLGFSNYYLDASTLSEPYYVEYTFYDDTGSVLSAVTLDNITTNGGGPRTDCNDVYQSIYLEVNTGNTDYNIMYVGAGPKNLEDIMPAGTVQYTVQLFGEFTGTTTPVIPTPTPTPTPTSTPQCICENYTVGNPLEQSAVFTYTDCNTLTTTTVVLSPGQSTTVCACSGSVQSESLIQIVDGGYCGGNCVCWSYSVECDALSESQCRIDYVDCDENPQTLILNVGTSQSFCGCEGGVTVVYGQTTVTEGPACGVPATPTPTPSSTLSPAPPPPTPTPSCAYKEWTIFECVTGICDGGICTCQGQSETTVYTDCSVTNLINPGTAIYTSTLLTSPFVGDFVQSGCIYSSTGSDVTLVCCIGGPC